MVDTPSVQDRPQIAVGAVIVRDRSLLLIRRAQDPGEGLWSLPGGRVEKGETLSDALAREVREETGIDIEVGSLLGILEVTGDPHYVILDYIAVPKDDAEPAPADDVSEVRWVAFEDVKDLDCTPRFRESLRGWGIEV